MQDDLAGRELDKLCAAALAEGVTTICISKTRRRKLSVAPKFASDTLTRFERSVDQRALDELLKSIIESRCDGSDRSSFVIERCKDGRTYDEYLVSVRRTARTLELKLRRPPYERS